MSTSEFAGKRVFITGGSRGVGEAIVRRFVAGEATVGTAARSPLPEGTAAKFFVQADLSTRTGVDKIIREVLDKFGGLDILVHNAGGSAPELRRPISGAWQNIRHSRGTPRRPSDARRQGYPGLTGSPG